MSIATNKNCAYIASASKSGGSFVCKKKKLVKTTVKKRYTIDIYICVYSNHDKKQEKKTPQTPVPNLQSFFLLILLLILLPSNLV